MFISIYNNPNKNKKIYMNKKSLGYREFGDCCQINIV